MRQNDNGSSIFFTYKLIMTQRTLRGTRLKKVRTSGFRARMASKTGRRVINARRKKGRVKLTV